MSALPEKEPVEAGSPRPIPLSHDIDEPETVPSTWLAPEPELKLSLQQRLAEVNKEIWLVLSILSVSALLNYLLTGHRMILGLYTLPTLFSAYFYGRRHATLTAFASIFLVGLMAYFNPSWFGGNAAGGASQEAMFEFTAWGGILVLTGYTMGALRDRDHSRMRELRETYHGLLLILRQFISKDKYTENHCYRVSIYAARIATHLGFSADRIEDVRAASLLHDIGKLEISRKLIYKAARLNEAEYEQVKRHVNVGAEIVEPLGGPLRKIIPIILAHHERYDGSGYHSTGGRKIPMEARIIAVADVYDALTSDRPYRKAMSPFEAKDIICKGSGADFDPDVVSAFLKAFKRGELEIPDLVL